jgi:hypothetical protein
MSRTIPPIPRSDESKERSMYNIFYLIGVVVVILFVLSFLGLA